MAGMDPSQRLGYAGLTYLPKPLVRAGVMATVGVGRLTLMPMIRLASYLLGGESAPGASGTRQLERIGHAEARGRSLESERAETDSGNDRRRASSSGAGPNGGDAGGGGLGSERGPERSAWSEGIAARAAAANRQASWRLVATGMLGMLGDVLQAPKLADGWWQVRWHVKAVSHAEMLFACISLHADLCAFVCWWMLTLHLRPCKGTCANL